MNYGISNTLFCLLILIVTVTALDEPPKFHTQLSADDRRHYFGTELIEEVPQYEYTTPQPVDRRRKRSSAADDSLEYIIEAFGDVTHLVLDKNKDLIAPGCIVQHLGSNETNKVYPCASQEVNCFYTGRSSNHSDSWVAASLCNGMHAMIGLPDKTLVVQPISDQHLSRARRDTLLPKPYIVYHYQDKKREKRECSTTDNLVETEKKQHTSRSRRSSGKKFVETTVVVDPVAYRFHGSGTEQMVKTVMNIVAQRFLDPSLETPIYFTLKKISILKQMPTGLTIDVDSGITLDSFCNWQTQWNPPLDSDPIHSDYVVLITKVDLEHQGIKSNTGLARKGMCGQKTKCSVTEDNGLGTGLIIAHETGHVLGMNHDSEGNDCPDGVNLMSSQAPSGSNAFKWSRCSAAYLSEFLSSSDSTCLDDEPMSADGKIFNNNIKPGTIYSVNQQCKLMLGNEAEVCADTHANGQDVCGAIVCRAKHNSGVNGCIIYATPRMDGTDCGNRKWCIDGECVDMGSGSPGPRNGGWSDWDTSFSECSRTCGGGVKVKQRYCNNPEPRYGGKACVGEPTIAETCNMEDCRTSQHDFMAQQCAATDNTPINGRTYKWAPNTDSLGDDSCKINCVGTGTSIFAKRGVNVDGTECFMDSRAPFTKCVGGKCKEFGCDGHVGTNSTFLKYDKCGLCNGRGNTCKQVMGTFHTGKPKAFTTFVTIPVGSTGILVTQKNTFCYLSAMIKNKQLFSTTIPNLSGTYKKSGTVIIKYQSRPERLEIVGPIDTPVQLQVYKKYGPPYTGIDPDIYYEYHVPTTPQAATYLWKTKAGACSKTCGTGQQIPTLTCESNMSGTVDDFNCNIYNKPKESVQPCNTHACPPRWRASNWGQCSKTCGGGQFHRTVECIEENNDVETILTDSRCPSSSKPVVSGHCNPDDCPGTWSSGAWSSCSDTCGRGVKTRQVRCHLNGVSATDDKCLDGDKPKTRDYCNVKPCRPDISGAACKDEKDDCFGSYGEDVCTGDYKSWARLHCMQSCGVCSVTSTDCTDTVTNCDQYMDGFCTDASYATWAKNHCKKHCGFCESEAITTTTKPTEAVSGDCLDTDNCEAYGDSVCTSYVAWSKNHCKKFCSMCETQTSTSEYEICEDTAMCAAYGESVCNMTDFANTHCRKYCGLCQGCQDQEENCAAYGSNVCTEYKGWASTHCQGYCGMCTRRKRRSVRFEEDSEIVPPLIRVADTGAPPPLATRDEDILAEELFRISAEDTLIDEDEVIDDLLEADKVPSRPLCNTVRTASFDSLNMIGNLLPGETCEQTIALQDDNKIFLQIIDKNFNCESGDTLRLIDVIKGDTIDICDITQTEWTSSGNIVVVRVTAGSEGHGIAYTYRAIPQLENNPACNQYLVGAVGQISPVRYPVESKNSEDLCSVYITATPGNSVQLVFNKFNMTQRGVDHCVTVTDLEGGEEDDFCGNLSPFIWESRGSLVKLDYEQFSLSDGFHISYTVQK